MTEQAQFTKAVLAERDCCIARRAVGDFITFLEERGNLGAEAKETIVGLFGQWIMEERQKRAADKVKGIV